MTYIKILTALTALALLTACGSPTVNIGEVNINNGALCDTNPYGANCGEEFEAPRQTIASGCRTDDSGALCDDATTFVCDKNFDDMLCDDITEYVDQREVVMEQCTDTKTQKACDEEDRITACDANEFATDCAEQKYVDKRRMTCTGDKTSTRCMPTVDLICGEDGDIFDDFCTGLPDTDTMRANACQTHGTDAGGDDSCAASLASSCTITDPFIYAGCKDVEGIAGVRMMYCETPANAWDGECMDGMHGTVSATRMTACQMFGTDIDTGGHATCATSLAIVCNDIANPFIYEGCDDVAGINAGVRKIFCETPATAWNPKCMDTTHGAVDATRVTACEMFGTDTGMGGDDSCANSLISVCLLANPFIHEGCDDVVGIDAGLRITYCQTPANAWNPKCMQTTHGAVDTTRVTACEMFGTNTGMGGDDSCATSLISVCLIANPFIHAGCDDVVGIDAGVRTMFCEMPANAWNPKCMDTTHGTVIATRVTACQMFGTNTGMGGDDSCATSLISVCLLANPFIHEGCDDVVGIDAGLRKTFCETPANAWNPKCMDIMHGAVDTTRVTACEMFGTDTGMGGDDSCANSLASSCTITNPFIHAGCDDVTDIDSGVRTMFCEMPANAWNPKCMDTTHGTVNATRVTACQMFGTGMGGDDSCATSLISVCLIANPFIHEGCNDVVGIDAGVRTMFCEMPANAWNPKCMDTTHGTVNATRVTACEMFGTDTGTGGDDSCATSLISVCLLANPFIHEGCNDVVGIDAGLRKTFCETPANAWNPKCMDTTHGTVIATRMTACQMFGTGTGGDNSCAASLATVCLIANPFIHEGCDDVAGIDAGVRTMYCQMSANAWNPKCMDTTHGTVTATRGDACLEFGIDTTRGGHRSCVRNTLAESSCASNPFDPANPGCAILTKFEMIVRTYCKASHVAGCPTATYDAWVASFPDNAPLLASNLAPTAGNKFLQGKETGLNTTGLGDFTADSFNFQTATYNGMLFGGSATEGVAFQYGNIGGKRYFYAGLLSGTDLGPPLTTVTNATWYGRIVVLQNRDWYLTRAGKIYGDIDLTVNYDGDNNGTIGGVYGEYTVNGTFDSKGIMGGNVTRSKIDTYTRRTFIGDSNATTTTTYSFQRRVVGPLTGLIGQTEAVGVFIGQDFTNYDDKPRQVDANLNNFKHPATRAGFAGGFIARSTRP